MNQITDATVHFDDLLRAATQCALTRYPDETRRILRGLQLARTGHVYLYNGYAKVRSQTHSAVLYTIDSTGCTCTDAKVAPDGRCKHRYSVWLMRKAKAQEAHGTEPRQYYATYRAPDGPQQGIAIWHEAEKRWIFSTDAYPHAHYAESGDLTFGGHVPTAEAQREQDGDLGEKFGRPQYPDVDHAAIDARLAERKARRERGWQYGN
jgi:hypothetical protein